MHSTPVKAVKATIIIDAAAFPWHAVPAPGTPGGKTALIPLTVDYGEGTVSVTIKGSGAQKAKQTTDATPQGGYVVLQGKLADGGKMLADAGMTFQAKKIDGVPTPEAAAA